MIHQYLNRTTVLCTVAFMIFSSSVLLAEESKSKRKLPKLPFPVNIDKQAGETEGLPNRIQDNYSGMWYRLVPKGTYTIGSDKLADSKEIQVRLSPYYISETCVTYAQVAQYLLKELLSLDIITDLRESLVYNSDSEETKKMRESLNKLTPAQQKDYRLLYQMWEFPSLLGDWKKVISLDSKLYEEYKKALNSVIHDDTNKNKPEAEITDIYPINAKQKETFIKMMDALTKKLSQQKSKTPYGHANGKMAWEYARSRGVRLPTEAQWEVAARLASAGNLKVENMLGNHQEWCSDYYAYDYFKRKVHFDNPTGPRRSKLSEQQIDNETVGSEFKFFTKIRAMSLRVLRGKTVTQRHSSSLNSRYHDTNRQPRSIRLVINLK